MPKFATTQAWEQAEMLMQPVFIRVIANIGRQLEQSPWKGSYLDTQVWPEGVSDDTKATVLELRQQLDHADPAIAAEIEEQLASLPSPQHLYQLCLEQQNRQITVDIWELCYQICFRNYSPVLNAMDQDLIVEIDTRLIDEETRDVNWQQLDNKAKQLIDQIFTSLNPPP